MNISELYDGVFSAFAKRFSKIEINAAIPERLAGFEKPQLYLALPSFDPLEVRSDGSIEISAHFEARIVIEMLSTEDEANLTKRAANTAGAMAVFLTQNNFGLANVEDAVWQEASDESFTFEEGLFKMWLVTFDVRAVIADVHGEDTEL